MLTTITEADWTIVLQVFAASRSRRGDKWSRRRFHQHKGRFKAQSSSRAVNARCAANREGGGHPYCMACWVWLRNRASSAERPGSGSPRIVMFGVHSFAQAASRSAKTSCGACRNGAIGCPGFVSSEFHLRNARITTPRRFCDFPSIVINWGSIMRKSGPNKPGTRQLFGDPESRAV
jgi:hypothetical protein